jgi:hypothetical protein
MAQFNRIIDNVRNSKYHKASEENKAVFNKVQIPVPQEPQKKLSLNPARTT